MSQKFRTCRLVKEVCIDDVLNQASLLALMPVITLIVMPIIALIGLSLNLFVRARGGRSLKLRLKGFGIDLSVETSGKADQTNEEQT